MARKRSVYVTAINVRVHPVHSQEIYTALIHAAYEKRQAVRVRGDQFLILQHLRIPDDGGAIYGTIARFTEIDMNLPWFDMAQSEQADDTLLLNIAIPDHLKPNYVPFEFVFDPLTHLFAFEHKSSSQSVSPRLVASYLSKLLEAGEIRNRFGDVSIDVVQDREGLEAIRKMRKIRSLRIAVGKPNSDDAGYKEIFQNRLLKQNVKTQTTILDAMPGTTIEPDEETNKLMELALTDGSVVAEGRDEEDKPVIRSTVETPLIHVNQYDPDKMLGAQAFRKAALELIAKISALMF